MNLMTRTSSTLMRIAAAAVFAAWSAFAFADLPEIMEIPAHPWFIGVQFHPELKSRPLEPHPLFTSFIAAAVQKSRLV